MTDCSKIPTLTLVEESKKAMEDIKTIVKSSQTTYESELTGEAGYTVTGLNQLFGGINVGDYIDDTVLSEVWEYTYNTATGYGYKVKSKSSLPYSIDVTTYPDPEDDPNLKRVSDVNHEDVTKAQEELLLSGSKIYPRSGYLANGMGVTADTTHLRVLDDGEPTIVAMSPIADGVVSLLTDTGATIGGIPVKFTQWKEIEYFSDGSRSSVDNMVSGYPTVAKVGDVCVTTRSSWIRVSDSTGTLNDFKPVLNTFAEDISESDIGNAINQAMENNRLHSGDPAFGGLTRLAAGIKTAITPIELNFGNAGADVTDGVMIEGEGPVSTVLNYSGITGQPVIRDVGTSVNPVQHYMLKNFGTIGGLNGVRLEKSSRGLMESVNASQAAQDGFWFGNCFVATHTNLFADNNTDSGVNYSYALQKTSININGGYALNNGNHGWEWGFMNYSHAHGVASDGNQNHGHLIRNSKGFSLTNCGAEANGRASFAAIASATYGSNENVTISGSFTVNGNSNNEGWGSVLHMLSTDGTKNEITLEDAHEILDNGSVFPSVYVDGQGCYLTLNANCSLANGWQTANGGYVNYLHTKTLLKESNFSAGAAREICSLRSTQNYQTTYGGLITIHASNLTYSEGAKRTATYHLLVNKQFDGTRTVIEIAKAGETDGSTSDSAPSFSWSINGADKLVATAVTASIAGDFFFEIDTDSQVISVPL